MKTRNINSNHDGWSRRAFISTTATVILFVLGFSALTVIQPRAQNVCQRAVDQTITTASRLVGWNGTTATAHGDFSECTLLRVAVPPSFWASQAGQAAGVRVEITPLDLAGTSNAADVDLFIYQSDANGVRGTLLDKSAHSLAESGAASNVQETGAILRASGYYLIEVRYQDVVAGAYTAEARLWEDYTTGQISALRSPFEDDIHTPQNETCGTLQDSFWHTELEPSVAVDPTDSKHIVGAWQQDRDRSGGARGIVVGVSFDGGQSWQRVTVPGVSACTNGPVLDIASDPWLSFGPTGELYLSSLSAGLGISTIQVNKAMDGGRRWSAPIQLIVSPQSFAAHNDKEVVTADPYDTRYAYVSWALNSPGPLTSDPGTGTLMFTRTQDGGKTWEPARAISAPRNVTAGVAFGPLIVVLPDPLRTVVNVFSDPVTATTKKLSLLRSTNHGASWEMGPTVIATMWTRGVTDSQTEQDGTEVKVRSAGTYFLFSAAVDPRNGNLYAVWQDSRFSSAHPDQELGQFDSIAFSQSLDGGATWSTPIRINKTPTDDPVLRRHKQQAFNPSIVVAPNGVVAVTYYDFRFYNSSQSILSTDYWAVFGDPTAPGGLTNAANWAGERRLTDASFDTRREPKTGDGYMTGDYLGLAVSGNNFVTLFAQPHGTDQGSIFFRRFR